MTPGPAPRRPVSRRAGAAGLFALPLLMMSTPGPAVEEPRHKVLRIIDERVDPRSYAPYVVAEAVMQVDASDAGSQVLPVSTGYVFGKNKGERTMAMTAAGKLPPDR